MKKIKAFTLVELMVVMAIIAFLSVGAYAGLTFALRQGRDTQRMRKVDSVQTALVAHFADFAIYPGCPGKNGQSVSSATGYYYCPNAFEVSAGSNSLITGETGDGGLSDYFEGEFVLAPVDPVKLDEQFRYYAKMTSPNSDSAMQFAVCIALENPRGGNVEFSGSTNGDKGCYCVGADQSEIACNGMTPLYE